MHISLIIFFFLNLTYFNMESNITLSLAVNGTIIAFSTFKYFTYN